MRLAVFGDIHGNLPAFEAALADIRMQAPDALICLGDVASTGAQPRECVQLLHSLNCPVVMGNADEDLLSPRPFTPRGFPDEREIHDLDEWARQQLTEIDLDVVRTYQATVELDLNGVRLLAFHGSPASNREEVLAQTPETKLDELRTAFGQQPIWVGGHTHRQLFRTLPGWTLLNPGSVGLAFEKRGERYVNVARAEYLLLDVERERVSVTLRRVPFDVQALRAGILAAGLPHATWLAEQWVPA